MVNKLKKVHFLFWWFLPLAIFTLTGCSALNKENWSGFGAASFKQENQSGFGAAPTPAEKKFTEMVHNLEQAKGKMTYAEAVFYFGQPSHVGSDTQRLVASWNRQSQYGQSFANTEVGKEMVLSFDEPSKILQAWHFRKW